MSLRNRFLCWGAIVCCFAVPNGSLAQERDAKLVSKSGEWPRWRGANHDGISQDVGLLKEWPKGGPPLAWRSQGLGRGFASVSLIGNRLYTMGNDGGGILLCLEIPGGNVVWKAKFGKGDANCTPTIDGDRVYGLARNGDLACVKMETGEIVWQRSFQAEFGGKEPTWGYSESPLIDGDVLIASPGSNDGFLVALNKLSGETVWKATLDQSKFQGHGGAGYSSPMVATIAGVRQYVTLSGKGLIGVDAKTGQVLWLYDKVANGTANIPTPIIQGNQILCSSGYGDGGTALLKLSKKGKQIKWEEVYYRPAKELQNHHGGMLYLNGNVFMGHGHNNGFPVCFNFHTGKDLWRAKRGPGSESAAVGYADKHLYFRYQDGTMALIEANPKEYKLKGSFKLASKHGESWPHPVIAGGMLYIRDQHELLVYDVREK